jgi:4-hydroxy-tetrahydrodipicolinate synthase
VDQDKIKQALSGPIASVRTPFNEDGSIDYVSLRRMIDFDIQAGSKAMLVTYGDSLFSLLSEQEIADMTKAVVEHTAGRAVVVACTGMWATGQSVEFAKLCRSIGADILMVIASNWYPGCCTPESTVKHHKAIAAEIPVMANSAGLNKDGPAAGLSAARSIMETVDNVIAMKLDVTGEFDRTLTGMVKDRWAVFAGGQKSFHMDVLPYGCHGYLATFITFKPEVTQVYWRAIQANDIPAAVRIIEKIDRPFFEHILPSRGGFDAAIHGVMELSGLAKRWRRKPFYSLNNDEMDELAEFLDGLPQVN